MAVEPSRTPAMKEERGRWRAQLSACVFPSVGAMALDQNLKVENISYNVDVLTELHCSPLY
jgi:hypothetical protein